MRLEREHRRVIKMRQVAAKVERVVSPERDSLARAVAQARIDRGVATLPDFRTVIGSDLPGHQRMVAEKALEFDGRRHTGTEAKHTSMWSYAAEIISYAPGELVPFEPWLALHEAALQPPGEHGASHRDWKVANRALIVLGADDGVSLRRWFAGNINNLFIQWWMPGRLLPELPEVEPCEDPVREIREGTMTRWGFMHHHAPERAEQTKELCDLALYRLLRRRQGDDVRAQDPMDIAADMIAGPELLPVAPGPDPVTLPDDQGPTWPSSGHRILGHVMHLNHHESFTPGSLEAWTWAEAHRVWWLVLAPAVHLDQRSVSAIADAMTPDQVSELLTNPPSPISQYAAWPRPQPRREDAKLRQTTSLATDT